jgi:hypothetical protein
VLGRPVRFSTDSQKDRLAQARLLDAAFRAGYEKVYFQYEPIAAAYHYASTIGRPQNILVFDFGGGTLDITVMRLDRRQREVLATGGIPVAGDVFDQKLVRAKLPRHFGEGSRYGPRHRELPVPKWIYDVFSNWQTIMELQTPDSRKMLRDIAQTARKKGPIEALISLVSGNYSLQMFDLAEQAKRELSDKISATINFSGPGFKVIEMVTRSEFENIIRNEIQTIDAHLDETLRSSGLAPGQIDAVVRTGGSSQIPAFQQMLADKFGREKVQSIDVFSSVTSGLGIVGQAIAAGEVEVVGHTPDEAGYSAVAASRQGVPAVNLDLMQRRLTLAEGLGDRTAEADLQHALVRLAEENRLEVTPIPGDHLAEELPIAVAAAEQPASRRASVIAALDEPLLLVTSTYRFFLATPRQILESGRIDVALADMLHLKRQETISALGRWAEIKRQPRLLLVTSKGYARAYPIEPLRESIEGPVPLQFNQPLPGVVIRLFGARPEDNLLIGLDSGRLVRLSLAALPLQGLQAINRRPEEKVVAAVLAGEDEQVILLTADGYGKRLPAAAVPLAEKANSRGKVMIARRPLGALLRANGHSCVWAMTPDRFLPFDPADLPLDDDASTRSHPLLRLAPGEEILAALQNA